MSIKYYQLAKDEEPPDEFCAVRDIGGEPSEYTFYVPETENAKLREEFTKMDQWHSAELIAALDENAKLRALVKQTYAFFAWADGATFSDGTPSVHAGDRREVEEHMRELGIEVDGVTMARLRSDRTVPRVIVADGDTDCATGHCECGGCGGAIDCWDRFCRHCGRELEDA